MNDKPTIKENCVVQFHYTLHDQEGTEVETSRDSQPAAVLISHGALMVGLEEALLGRTTGDQFETTIEAAKAYGELVPGKTQRISKKYVANAARMKPGMATQVQTDEGPRTVTITKVGGKFMDVDLNHPLAGQQVRFEIEILGVRDASEEELAHGHVHGPGGHEH